MIKHFVWCDKHIPTNEMKEDISYTIFIVLYFIHNKRI